MRFNKKTSDYLIELLRSVINEDSPKEKPEGVDWDDIYSLALFHKVDEMVFHAISKLMGKPEGREALKWEKQHEKNQIVNMVQTGEGETIINEASARGIDILPLKGSVLKNIYPNPEFRQMGDLDYLVLSDESTMKEMGKLLHELGYEDGEGVGLEASHDVYIKPPYMEVEVHRRLLPTTEENHWHTDDIWDRLVKDEDNPHLMHMTPEDFYLFHLLHFEKHYSMGGSGIRSIIDQYYLMKNYGATMDFDYINKLLVKMNYVEFEAMCKNLAKAWFEDGLLNDELEQSAEYIINSGAFGTFEQYQKWRFEQYRKQGIKTKKGLFFRRMFMERERMENIYPSLKKHGWLLPFCWVHRLIKAVLFRRNKIKMEINSLRDKK